MTSPSLTRPRVLYTGAAGTIGKRIVPLLARDYDLVLIDRQEQLNQNLPIQAVDIMDFAAVRQVMRGCTHVVHMAIASARDQEHMPDHEADDQTMAVNMIGTQHVFEAALQLGVQRVVYGSSMTIMLGEPRLTSMDAQTPVRPNSLYACTKLFGEQLAEMYSRELGLSTICLRLGQPVPLPPRFGIDEARVNGRLRSVAVAFDDIALAVRCALTAPAHHTVVQVCSESDQTTFPRLNAELIAYRPRWRFDAQGEHCLDAPVSSCVPGR